MSDVGMTGDYESVIGMDKDEPLQPLPAPHLAEQVRAGQRPGARCAALAVETDDATGLAMRVGPVRLGGMLEEAQADVLGLAAARLPKLASSQPLIASSATSRCQLLFAF